VKYTKNDMINYTSTIFLKKNVMFLYGIMNKTFVRRYIYT